MTVTLDEFRGLSLLTDAYVEVTDLDVLQAQELATCFLPCLTCLPEVCRVQAGVLAILHTLELTNPACGISPLNIVSIANESDSVKFGPRGIAQLESTQWGSILRELLRQHSSAGLYHGGAC